MRCPIFLVFAFASILSHPLWADIYKTVDKNGHTVYTDLPPANSDAKPVELQSTNTIPKIQSTGIATPTTRRKEAYPNYTIRIVAPSAGTELMPDQRDLTVSIYNSFPLQDDLFYAYLIDGAVAKESTDTTVVITEPPRGEHKLMVEVRNKAGEQFGQSESVIFTTFRPILKHKPKPVPSKK